MLGRIISSILLFLLGLGVVAVASEVPTKNNSVEIIFVGDIMLGRSVMSASLNTGDDYYPFRKVSGILRDTDLVFANLENPIVKNCPRTDSGLVFCTTQKIAKGLNYSGIDIISLANNHSGNYGESGFNESKKYLDEINVSYTGVDNLIIEEVRSTKFGFLGFDLVSKKFTNNDRQLIVDSNGKVDVLIIGVHWGNEYQAIANNAQQTVAKEMVDAGADLIVGHHPHWVQNNEEINGVPVYYSLGNFIFDQMWSENTKKGMLLKITFENGEITKKEEFNTYISKIGQPEILGEF